MANIEAKARMKVSKLETVWYLVIFVYIIDLSGQ